MQAERVIAVTGISFCGSSVLNLVLDSHPEVYGGGELHKLFKAEKSPRCSVCQYGCRYWTKRALAAVPKQGLYAFLAGHFQRRIIVNSAKTIDHFLEISPLNDDIPHYYAVMTKHPLRHIASYVVNKFFVNNNLIKQVDKGQVHQAHGDEMLAFVRARLTRMCREYDELRGHLDTLGVGHSRGDLRYEDFVEDTAGAISPMLSWAGLSFREDMLDFTRHSHHPIGGNRGPHHQVSRQQGQVALSTARFVDFRKRYYEENTGLAMDNKFRDAFHATHIDAILRMPEYQTLCGDLGYDPYRFDSSLSYERLSA